MILTRCKDLQGLLRSLKQAELDQKHAATLTPVQEALAERHTRLADTAARSRVLLLSSVTTGLSLPDPADLTASLQAVRKNLAGDPFAVTKGRDYKALLKYLDALLDGLHDQAVRAWSAWVDRQTARIDDAELARYESLPGYGIVAAEIRRLQKLVAALPRELPETSEEMEEARRALVTLREQIAKLPRTDDAEVREFLDGANSPDGASIDLLTPKVIAWLKEQPGLYERYRVVVR